MKGLRALKIGVFFGSRSPEHDISIITAQLILAGLREAGFRALPVYLSPAGHWYISPRLATIKFFQEHAGNQQAFLPFGHWYLDLEKSHGKLFFRTKSWWKREERIDFAFPAFHGSYGEDGTFQGLCEMLEVPYAGCGVAASAIAMDKVLTKLFYQSQRIPTVPFRYYYQKSWQQNKDKILGEIKQCFSWPVFIKPARLGSSIGVARVENEKDLAFALEVAFHYDGKVLVERGIEKVVDLTCALLGNNNPRPSLVQESTFKDSFFSYAEKYLKEGGAQTGKATKNIIIPARLSASQTRAVQQLAVKIYSLLECAGTARVDFLYDKENNQLYANEINTMPGTLYHHLWQKSGVSLRELLSQLIRLGIERHQEKKQITTTFQSNVLKQLRATKLKPTA